MNRTAFIEEPTVLLPTTATVEANDATISENAGNTEGILSSAINSFSKKTNGVPTWTIIVAALGGSVIVSVILGLLMHHGGKKIRQNRAQKNLMKKKELFMT